MKYVSKLSGYILRFIGFLFNLLLIYLILMSCNKIQYYAAQKKTFKVHTPTYTRIKISNGQPLFGQTTNR
jgi:hypothetical protein